MPTKSERKALLFLAAVACLGGGVRLLRAHDVPSPPVAARRALDAQISTAAGRTVSARRDTDPPARPRRRPVEVKPRVTVVIKHPMPPPPPPDPYHRVDVDRATTAELQALPGIGPALAARIVAYRDSAGPFGGPARLGRVKGIGPATLQRLDSLITFSGVARP